MALYLPYSTLFHHFYHLVSFLSGKPVSVKFAGTHTVLVLSEIDWFMHIIIWVFLCYWSQELTSIIWLLCWSIPLLVKFSIIYSLKMSSIFMEHVQRFFILAL